jgi:glycosyltransferase involved in cell wall biosynthesis
MASEVDHLIVADNGSTDGTRKILLDLLDQLPITLVDDPDAAYYQSRKMSALAEQAAAAGAEWIVPFDADEIWYSPDGRIRDTLKEWQFAGNVAGARLLNHLCTALDENVPNPFQSMVWRQRDFQRLPKVAFRWQPGAVIHQGNHGVSLPDGNDLPINMLEVRHFPVRSADQLIRKARNGAEAYRLTDLDEDSGRHWRGWGRILDERGEEALGDVFRAHWWYLSPVDAGLVYDPAPYRRWDNT